MFQDFNDGEWPYTWFKHETVAIQIQKNFRSTITITIDTIIFET